ncbi:hypothetical protein AB0K60_29985 [Thermopolyspora sp. NPDC052614]|uniref:hypothetical protein n=1 Tax=Thermopolyspora sp. NPDC052614 TaxID=3155682 RepID=UPI003446FD18
MLDDTFVSGTERADPEEFFALFDSIVRRPPAFHDNRLLKILSVAGLRRVTPGEGDRPLPLLTFSGPRDVRLKVVHALAGHYEKRTPNADITPSALDGDTPSQRLRALLEKASDELGREGAGGELRPAPRFPLVTFLLWLCEEPEPGRDLKEKDVRAKEAEMRRRIKARGRTALLPVKDSGQEKRDSVFAYVDRTLGAWLAGAAVLGAWAGQAISVIAALAVLLASVGAWLVYTVRNTRDWAGRRRFRWFYQDRRRQPYLSKDVTTFERFAVRVVEAARRDDTEELDKLLVHAFLEDLRQAYRRRRLRRAPWARTGYALLTMYPPERTGVDGDDDPGDPTGTGLRFMRLVHDVREETGQLDPLLVINTLPDSPVDDDDHDHGHGYGHGYGHGHGGLGPRRTDLARAAEDYEAWLHEAWLRPSASPARSCYLQVNVPRTGRDLAVDRVRGRAPLPRPPVLARRGVYWVLVASVLLMCGGFVTLNELRNRANAAEAARYCGTHAIARTAQGECVGISDGSEVFNATLRPVIERIRAQNDQVMRDRARKPYITLVYLGPLSVRHGGQGLVAGTYGELAGLLLLQEEQNREQDLRLRLLIGNVGEFSAHAERVARDVVALSRRDPTIVGVVGLGQSVDQTQRAIRALSSVGLPMIGTVNTYDKTAEFGRWRSPYYFHVAPGNERQAAAAARWARLGLTGPDGKVMRARTAAVFYDATPGDLYGENLATDFAGHFGEGLASDAVQLLPYEGVAELQRVVDQACRPRRDVYYYAGRAPQLNAFLDDLERSCGTQPLYVMAGDEITRQVIQNPIGIQQRTSLRLYYTPLAFRDLWELDWVKEKASPPGFFAEFEKLKAADPDIGDRPSEGHAMLAHDAALAFVQAAQRAFQAVEGTAPTSGMVLYELRNINQNGRRLSGATGLIDFGVSPDRHDPAGKPVLLVYVHPRTGPTLTQVCGRVTEDLIRDCDGLPQEGGTPSRTP